MRNITRAGSDRARENIFKLTETRFGLDIWKKFLLLRLVRPWDRLVAVAAPSLEVSQASMDEALSNLI